MQPIPFLKIIGASFGLLGVVFAIGAATPAAPLVNGFVDLAHFPLDGAQAIQTKSEALTMAIAGGLSVGLGVVIWLLAHHFAASHPQAVAQILTYAALAWYIPDSLGSLLAGAWFNVVMNSGFLALLLWPAHKLHKGARAGAARPPLQP